MANRRTFIKKGLLAAYSSALGMNIVFGHTMPVDYKPVLLGQKPASPPSGKHPGMVVLNDRPWNVEAQAHLLDDKITPADKMFIRNNGQVPRNMDVSSWELLVDGESVLQPKKYSLADLRSRFQPYTYQLTLECGGNGRGEFNPPAKGNQWTVGAVSCAEWTGVRLRDLLNDVGIAKDALYIGYYGKDEHLSGDKDKVVISRGVPIEKAMMPETLLAYSMNGGDIPLVHGHPLRMVAGGWPASASGKWIHRLSVRNIVHDGPKMGGDSYRVPCEPVAPGTPAKNMCIIESMPVKSLVTYPKSGAILPHGKTLGIRGHAWAGEYEVSSMHYSIDFGATWHPCHLEKPNNRLAWQHWQAQVDLPQRGYYEVWARATDSHRRQQPMVVPGWNPKGYLNNACHRIAVKSV